MQTHLTSSGSTGSIIMQTKLVGLGSDAHTYCCKRKRGVSRNSKRTHLVFAGLYRKKEPLVH
jgi:hypothetical protein